MAEWGNPGALTLESSWISPPLESSPKSSAHNLFKSNWNPTGIQLDYASTGIHWIWIYHLRMPHLMMVLMALGPGMMACG